jgi:hypothetical protein
MASEKISDMPAATQLNDADLIPIVQGGANLSVTRPIFNIAPSGESLTFSAGGSGMVMDSGGFVSTSLASTTSFTVKGPSGTLTSVKTSGDCAYSAALGFNAVLGDITHAGLRCFQPNVGGFGSAVLEVETGGTMFFIYGSTNILRITATGVVTFRGVTGSTLAFQQNSGQLLMDAVGHVSISDGLGTSVNVGYKAANPGDWIGLPTDLGTAVDRLARALVTRTGPPIP